MSSTALHRKVQGIVSRHATQSDQQEERIRAIQSLSQLQEATPSSSADDDESLSSSSVNLHRSFRLLLQNRTISIYRSFLLDFSTLRTELNSLETCLESSAQLATDLQAQLIEMKKRNASIFSESGALTQAQHSLKGKQELIQIFLSKFQLSPSDLQILNASDLTHEISEEFFIVLEKLTDIKKNIERMVSGANLTSISTPNPAGQDWTNGLQNPSSGASSALSGSHRINLDLLDTLSSQLEGSYEKLYRHIQTALSNHRVIKTSDLTPQFVRAFELLRNVPVYYEHCLSDFISLRRSLLIERFLKALSRGSGGSRPIELSAHDPVRYVSDILAWCHQAAANEKEFLMTLFPVSSSTPSANITSPLVSAPPSASTSPPPADYLTHLTSIFTSISRPLTSRIEQAFSVSSGSTSTSTVGATSGAGAASAIQVEIVFKVWNILKFYRVIMEPILPSTAVAIANNKKDDTLLLSTSQLSTDPLATPSASAADLLTTLSQLIAAARSSFFTLLSQASVRLQNVPRSVDLSPAPQLAEWIHQLSTIMSIYNAALLTPEEKEADFSEIMRQIMEPLLRAIGLDANTMSAASSTSSTSAASSNDRDQLIYRINVLQAALDVCTPFSSFVSGRQAEIQRLIAQQTQILVSSQARSVWRAVDLEQIIFGDATMRNTISPQKLEKGIKGFYDSLLSVGSFVIPQCDRILDSAHRRECRQGITALLSSQYRSLYSFFQANPPSTIPPQQIQSIFQHSPEHLDLLLDLQQVPQ